MMENSRYTSFEDKQFKELLDECYFHPSRKYASDEIKFIARNAMQLLWDMDGIVVHAGNGLIVDEKETIALADKYKMFIVGATVNDYLG